MRLKIEVNTREPFSVLNFVKSRSDFEANLASKVTGPVFLGDVAPLLRQDDSRIEGFDALRGAEAIKRTFTSHLPGEPWKGCE